MAMQNDFPNDFLYHGNESRKKRNKIINTAFIRFKHFPISHDFGI